MDLKSVEKQVRHIYDVQRVSIELTEAAHEEIDDRLENQKNLAATRWESCHRGYIMLFMTLNRGNKFPRDSFDIKIDSKQLGGETYDTYMRISRDRRNNIYSARPFVDRGNGIIDHQFEAEYFSKEFEYKYGTCRSSIAKVAADFNGIEASVELSRVNGSKVHEMTVEKKAVFLAALESEVLPRLENVEDTLTLVTEKMLDDKLNPELAKKLIICHS